MRAHLFYIFCITDAVRVAHRVVQRKSQRFPQSGALTQSRTPAVPFFIQSIFDNQRRFLTGGTTQFASESAGNAQTEHHPNRDNRRIFAVLFSILMVYFGVRYTKGGSANSSTERPSARTEKLIFRVIGKSAETSHFTRLKLQFSLTNDESDAMRFLQKVFTNGHVTLSSTLKSMQTKGVVIQWEVENSTVTCSVLYANRSGIDFATESDVSVALHRVKKPVGIDCGDEVEISKFQWVRSTMGFGARRHPLSFLGLPRRTDRLVFISSAEDIPRLYPIFCRCTGYAASGSIDYTLRSSGDKSLHRSPLLWIIECESPEDIPLVQELQHVAKGSHFFDFYVTTKKSGWKWPAGIGELSTSLLKTILPREVLDGLGNARAALPFTAERFCTGFVLSGSDAFIEDLINPISGKLTQTLSEKYDMQNMVRVVK